MRPATKILLFVCLTTSACATTQTLWNDYQSYPENKAFAMGSNGASGAAWSAATVEQAIHEAKSYCTSGGGTNCEVIDVNGGPPGAYPPASAQTAPLGGETSLTSGLFFHNGFTSITSENPNVILNYLSVKIGVIF